MNTTLLHTLPLATTTPFTPWGRPADQEARGWTQALAQAGGASLPPQGTSASIGQSAQASPTAFTAPPCLPQEQRGSSRPDGVLFESGVASRMHPGVAPTDRPPHRVPDPGAPIVPECGVAARTLPDGGGEVRDIASGRPRPAQPANPERSPVRIHVEQHATGLAVWLGVDGGEVASARVAAALSRLRTGEPIVSLVCNGIPVHARSRIPKEAP